MTYPNRGVLKAAMGHYLTESARTALEAMEPEEDVIELGPGKQMPVVGPNQILDMPLFTKIPLLPGSNTMFYRTNLGEKLYQPSATFDLNDPYCKIMAPKYKSLHDPHLRAYYKRKDNLRRLKKSGLITDKNKVVCTLKEFNEYRQYLTSRKLEFEKHYLKEQKMLEKQVTKLQDTHSLPEAIETSKYRDWLLKEERPTIQEQENVMRNRVIICGVLGAMMVSPNLEWKKKEMSLLMKIGDDVKREARIEEQQRKTKEEKLKRKQVMLEKKMAHQLKKLQKQFQREGLLPSSIIFPVSTPENTSLSGKKEEYPYKKSVEDINDTMELENASISLPDKESQFSKDVGAKLPAVDPLVVEARLPVVGQLDVEARLPVVDPLDVGARLPVVVPVVGLEDIPVTVARLVAVDQPGVGAAVEKQAVVMIQVEAANTEQAIATTSTFSHAQVVSSSELNKIIQNIMTWVVSAVTSILYPALTKFEERVRTRVYTISEESVVSSENSSSCTSCNEDLCESYGGLPSFASRKVSFTNTSMKPTTSSPSEFRSTSGKPVSTSLLSSKSSFTSFTKSTHLSLDSEILKGKFKRGKTAVFFSPSKDHGLLSTTPSMKSSKSDSHLSQLQKSSTDDPENVSTLYHSKQKHRMPKGLLCKPETTMTTDSEELPSTGGEQNPPDCSAHQREPIDVKDLKCIFSDLKLPLARVTAVILDDIFKKILGDLGCTACSVSISMEVLLESISDSLLGSHSAEPPVAGSVSRVASFVANDIVENVLSKLHCTTQKKYFETISRDDFSTEWKAMCLAASEKYTDPDPTFWRAQMPLSFESMLGVAEEIVQIIIDKLKVFAMSSQTKVSQFELFSKIKAIGIPLEQLYAAVPPHTAESEAANAIVKDTIRKIVSKTVASSETNILQYVEEMIGNILCYIQRQVSQEEVTPSTESSVILQIINDVFNDLSTEKLRILSPSAKPSSCPKIQIEPPSHKTYETSAGGVTIKTLFTTEKNVRKPFPPVNVPGMVIYAEAEQEEKDKQHQDGKLKTNKVPKPEYEGFGLEPRQRSRSHSKSALQDDGEFLDDDTTGQSKYLQKTESTLDTLVQNAIFCSLESPENATLSADPVSKARQGTTAPEWTLEQIMKQMEDNFKGEEQLPIIETVQNLLKETFQHVLAEQTAWPPSVSPSSLSQVNMSRQQAEGQPASKGQSEILGQILISDAEIHAFTDDLVKSVFQILSRMAQTDMQDVKSRQASLVFTDILPLSVSRESGKSLPTVHFRDPENDSEFPQEEVQSSRKMHISQPEHPSKSDLANDLVQMFIAKLESFVISKVESQLCLDVQNLKMSISSDFSSALQEEFKRILANQHGNLPNCLEDIFNSYNSSILAAKEKPEQTVSLSFSDLKSYASDVARLILKNLKHELDKEVDKISTPPVIFSESIAATQIVSMVLTIFAPQEHISEEESSLPRKESVLEKVFKKNPTYKRDLQTQIQNTVETLLNEIFQTIMLDMDNSGTGELQFRKAADGSTKKSLSNPAGVKSDASLVSNDLVDIVFEDLSSGLAAAMNMKGALSSQLQSLLYDFVQKTVEPLAQLKECGSKAGHKSRFPDPKRSKHQVPGVSKAEKSSGRKLVEFSAKQLPDIKDFSPEGIAKYLVDNVFLRLELFVEEKLESELGMATKQVKPSCLESGYATSSAQKATALRTGNHCDKAKVAVQDSQYNLRLCAEKLTCTIVKVIQKDLEREMLSCQNLLPHEENASANEIMNDLLKIITVQIALTENEIQKRVLKRIFQKQQPGQHGSFPLLASVEDVLNQVTQRIMGDLGLLSSFNNDSVFFNSEPKSSHYNRMMESASQTNACNVAGEIVDGILNKMYSAVVDTLFSSSKLETNASGSIKGSSDIQKITLAVSQLQPSPQSLSEELIQSVLNKIACFAASHLEEVLPLSVQQRWKGQSSFQCDMQAGSKTTSRPRATSDDSDSSFLRGTLSKSDLTVYAKDVVSKVLGTIIDEFKTENYHRTIFQVNTLSSEQISKASELINSVVHDLHTDDAQCPHMHKQTSLNRSQIDGLPSTQMFFQFEMTTKDIHGKPKCLCYEDYACYLNQILPKQGILREIFEQQPMTDENINETLKMLQVAENIVSEVYMRSRDLESSVCILKKIQGELNERLFCCNFKKGESCRLFHSDSQAEIGSVARDIVASVFENVHRCLLCSIPTSQDKCSFLGRKDQAGPKGCAKNPKNQFTQPDFSYFSLKNAMDTIDKIAKETVECIVITLETFVTRYFRRDFKCNFLDIVKFPLESLSFAQLTRSLDSLSGHVGNIAETTVEGLRNKLQGEAGKGTLPTLGSTHNFLDFTKLGGAVTRECIETAFHQVQMLHSELSVYANNAVSSILEIIKHTLDRELAQKEANVLSSSSESLVVSETISVMLDRCNESLTEITSELMVENLQLEMSGRAFAKERALAQNQFKSPKVKTTSKLFRRVDSFPPINVPGMVIYSEEETEVQEEAPAKFPSVFKYSEWDAHGASEREKGRSRHPRRRRQDKGQVKLGCLEEDWLPRQSSIPEGSILEKLFKKTADCEGSPKQAGMGHQKKAKPLPHHESFAGKYPFTGPESTCYSAYCPLKLGHTAESIVNALLCEFGVEDEPTVQNSYSEKSRHLSPLKEKSHLRSSCSSKCVQPKQKNQSLLNRWEIRLSDSSDKTLTEESCLLLDSGSLLSKWESKQHIFKCKSPEKYKELELMACSPVPDPCETLLLANHIVLSVIKELITFQSRDPLDEMSCRSSLPAWKQELIQSESKWLQDQIWRNTYLPSGRKQSSCHDVFWEPLTQAVLSNVLYSISSPSARHNMPERNEFCERSLSMFCSVDACCPVHGLRCSKSPPINIEELAFHISEVIINSMCERNILQESFNRKGFQTRRSRRIFVPPLCLADFDNVYQPLVKEINNVLLLEIEMRSRCTHQDRVGDSFSQQHLISSPRLSRASRGDCRGASDVRRMSCLSTMDQLALKNRRLNNVASNLDTFIRSLKTSESKNIVNKVLHIILDSLWPDQSQNDFGGSYPDAFSQNMMPYQNMNRSTKKQLLYSSMCPHACKLSNDLFNSNLGLSPKSVVLLDVVSEKLIRALLDKCLLTDNFSSSFAFDEFPENEQLRELRKCDDEVLPYSYKEFKVQDSESCTSLFTYDVRYLEEPWVDAQSGVSSCESALDVLAHTLVKPVMTELSFNIEHPRQMRTSPKKMVEFTKPCPRKGHGQAVNKKHARYGKNELCSSSRSRRSESRATGPGRRHMRKRDRNRSVLDAAVQRRPVVPICTLPAKKPWFASCKKKYYRKEVMTVTEHGDHHQLQSVFSAIYSSLFLGDVVSQLLIKIFSSLRNKYDRNSCIDLHEMNTLFVHALLEEFKKASVGVLQRAEEKAYFSPVDSRTVNRITDSILREFGFQLAAEGDMEKDIENLAERAAEIILTEILDYQLPPAVFRRLPQSAFRNLKPGPIIKNIELCVCFPKVKRSRPPPPTYVTILSEKYLERVVSRLLTQLFPPSEDTPCHQDKRDMSDVDFNELCSYIIEHVMKSISKHKIWVAKKDDRCRLHSEKEIENMVDSVYSNMLKKSGSQLSIQKDVECRNTAFIDCMTSFIIREITNHHLQTFLSKDEDFLENPEPEALSENIVRTVLDSISESSVSSTEVFPAKFLEEIVSRVLSKIFSASLDEKKMSKGQPEIELGNVVKRIASSINLQFGRASVSGVKTGEEQCLGAPLSAVMDDVVDSVYHNMAREKQMVLGGDVSRIRKNIIYDNVKRLVEKGISDYLLHPLFSGDLSRISGLPALQVSDAVRDKEFHEDESWPPFSTLLSSGFLKDLITGLLSRIFPSKPPGDASSTWKKAAMSEADLSKLSTQLLNDVRLKLLKHEIRVIKDTHPEQYQYSEEDVQNLTDSLCSKIIQKSGSLEAVQRDVKNKSNVLIDQLAGFLVGDILQQHVEAFVCSEEEEASDWDRAAGGDSMGGLDVYKTAIKPLNLREAIERKSKSSPTSVLGNVISELLSKISDRFSDIPLSASGEDVGEVAMRLAKTVTKELAKAHINFQEGPDETLGSAPPEANVADQNPSYKGSICSSLSKEDIENVENALPCQATTLEMEEAVDYLLHSACPSNVLEGKCLIQENLMEEQGGPQEEPSASPYITVLSYPVLDAIIDRLFAYIFPLAFSTSAVSDKGEGLRGSELQDRLAQFKMDIRAMILKQAIWISTYGSEKETVISEKAIENMVESVYCDVLHEVLLQQPVSEDRESLNNLYVTQIACFIVNEMFKHHLQSLTSEYAPPYVNHDDRIIPDSGITVFPCMVLEKMLNQLLEKLFPNPENIADYAGKSDDFSETDFTEMAANLKSCVVTEILAHEVKLENVSERIPDMDRETEEDIANSVYNDILQKYQSQGELQNTLMAQGNGTVPEIAKLLIREILNFHFHPFLSSNDSSECSKWQKGRQHVSKRIYSAQFLEDVVVAFFCKFLSSPNILAYSKDTNLSENEMRNLVIELVNGLVIEFKMSEVKVMQTSGENICLPPVGAEKVIEISNSIYEKLLQQFGSEFEIFKAFQANSCLLAEKLAPVIIRDISRFQLLPLFTGDTSPYLFSFVEAETIVDRVETLLPEPPSAGSVFGDIFVKILHRVFPSWLPDSRSASPDPTVIEERKRSHAMSHLKEEPCSDASKTIEDIVQNICKTVYAKSGSLNRKQESTAETGFLSKTKQGYQTRPQLMQFENAGDTYSASFLKDIFSGLISKLLTSTASVCMVGKQGAEAEPSLKYLIESILKEFAKSPVKVIQIPEGGQTFPDVEKAEIAKIIHAALCSILQDQRSGVPICMNKENGQTLAEKLAGAVKKEILGYQIQEVQSKMFQDPASKPFEFGEMAKNVFTEVKKISTPSQMDTPCPFLVSQRFIYDVLAFLLSKILPLPTTHSPSIDTEERCAEFDFIHMKLLSKVMAEISKNKNAEVKYLDRVPPNRVVSQTVANSIYNNLLPEFGSTSDVQKCIRTGCTILLERIVDIVIKEISGDQMQMYFSEELNRQQEAIEAEKALEDQYGADSEPSEAQTQLRSHLKGLSSLILEEIAVKLLTKIFSSLPLDEEDRSNVASMKEVARKIINSLQNLLSNGELKVWQHDDSRNLASEDSRTVGEVVDSVYSDILKHSSSETSLYEDLTNSKEDFANRVACFMVSEISKHDFQPVVDSEKEIPSPSLIKLESEKILKKIISDMEAGKKLNPIPDTPTLFVSVVFLEEIVSRFLIRMLKTQYDLGIHRKKRLSKTDIKEITAQLKTSVEKEISKSKINLVASDHQAVLNPQHEEAVNQVVHTVISNVLEKSGSQKELYEDMTTDQAIFPEQVASIIINEISSNNSEKPVRDNSENETYSALELDRIVSKVLAKVNSHMELEEDESLLELSGLSECRDESAPANPSQTDDMPVKIVPYLGKRPLKVDPDIVGDHLAVLSIKTEPLEKLKKTCLSKMGFSLEELRRASASGKSLSHGLGAASVPEANKKKERRPSLDMTGRLAVKPKEPVCRNSFQSLIKPDITKVELLKDVESKQDLIIRLVAHDIDTRDYPPTQIHEEMTSESDEEEQITSVYQDKSVKVPGSASQSQSEQEDAKVTATTSLEGSATTHRSVFEKVSTALSKVFSRTSTSNLTQSATVEEKPPGD
ncbi:PREDICTED: fibrous sheath-interacting protein 2 [Thamnophis sirtalis]|uniref:Fibrous sheath-interacting protein 2 n=1 Tax=Thamnophis sirtalis TaxID=35019 RepID=A0A6I9XCR7_9SAUR|nr:PREDICTED: fibrous sheath-interacting protein 2 [Thamnophis sirtalis]